MAQLPGMVNQLDLDDLVRGEGKWRNMQEVIRLAFKQCIDVQKQQEDKISRLSSQVVLLREELSKRPTIDDIDRIVEMKLLGERKRSSSFAEIDSIRASVAHLAKEIEKKVSVSNFQSSLNNKVDKSEMLAQKLSKSSHKDIDAEIGHIKLNILDIKSQLEQMSGTLATVVKHDKNDSKTTEQVVILKSQVENIYRHLNDILTQDQVKHLLSEKVQIPSMSSR